MGQRVGQGRKTCYGDMVRSKGMALVREWMHKYVDIAQRNDGKERNWH